MPDILTRTDLDTRLTEGCIAPDCTHADHVLALHAACHPRKPLLVRYSGAGLLDIACAQCHTLTVQVVVHDPGAAPAPVAELGGADVCS